MVVFLCGEVAEIGSGLKRRLLFRGLGVRL